MFNQLQALMSTPEIAVITRGKAAAFAAAWEFWVAVWVAVFIATVIFAILAFRKGWHKDRYGDIGGQAFFIFGSVPFSLFILFTNLSDYRMYQLAKYNPDAWAVQQVINIAQRVLNAMY